MCRAHIAKGHVEFCQLVSLGMLLFSSSSSDDVKDDRSSGSEVSLSLSESSDIWSIVNGTQRLDLKHGKVDEKYDLGIKSTYLEK